MAKKPRYAVITLDEKVDVGSFFNLLSSNGYSNVAFVTSLTECQEVRKMMAASRGNTTPSSTLADLVAASPEAINESTPVKPTMPSTSVIVSKTTPLVFDETGTPPYKGNAEVINCKLCDNKIMCSRLSNLTNHVRRHSSVKQYSCVYCPYQHNEMSKVRTHMAGQHGDTLTAPNDNLTPELQKIWCAYMEKCFPGYLESQGKTGKNAVEVFGGRTLARMEGGTGGTTASMPICINLDEEVVPLTDKLHTCLECGDAVACEGESSTEPLIEHIQQKHADSCAPFKCGECGYLNAQEYEVSAHVSTEHAMIASVVDITEEPLSSNYHMFVSKFFPSVEGVIDDSPEVVVDATQLSAEDLLNGEEDSPVNIAQALNAEALLGAFEEESVSSPDENHHFPCTVCGCNFTSDDVDGMMYHAKEHYCIKQFGCPHCSFGSNELYEARNHLSEEHGAEGVIIDHNSDLMQQAWMQTMKECFPTAASHILKKQSKSESSEPSRKRLRI